MHRIHPSQDPLREKKDGKRRWLQAFWACDRCGSLNHIVLPAYRLERASFPMPSALAAGVVGALQEGGLLDLDELVMGLRRRRVPGVRHVFNSEVGLVLEFLKGRGVVGEVTENRTEKVIGLLRTETAGSRRMGPCPAETNQNVTKGVLVSLYAQTQTGPAHASRLVPSGVFCPRCRFHSMREDNQLEPG